VRAGDRPGATRRTHTVTRSRKTAVAVEERAADAYAGYVSDLRQEVLEPPEFILRDEVLQSRGAGRDRAVRDGVADWFEGVETAFPFGGGHGTDPRALRPGD
jgi:hypothetical protein